MNPFVELGSQFSELVLLNLMVSFAYISFLSAWVSRISFWTSVGMFRIRGLSGSVEGGELWPELWKDGVAVAILTERADFFGSLRPFI